jgi:hypothetical protein
MRFKQSELLEDVRLIVQRLRSGPINFEEDAACQAIHALYSSAIKLLIESKAQLQADNTFLQRHILAEGEAAKEIIETLQKRVEGGY